MRLSLQKIIIKSFKGWRFIRLLIEAIISKWFCYVIFYLNGVKIKSFSCLGLPYVHVSLNAVCTIGENFRLNNGAKYSDSGLNGKCRIEVRDSAILNIGNNVGMSDVTITCHEHIIIGNNVLLGVGAQIRDSDNHSLNPEHRKEDKLDWKNKKTSPIQIKDCAFIGAYTFILKGVTIGENSIIGACSVVTKNIPDNEIWAGNPAKFVKNIMQGS